MASLCTAAAGQIALGPAVRYAADAQQGILTSELRLLFVAGSFDGRNDNQGGDTSTSTTCRLVRWCKRVCIVGQLKLRPAEGYDWSCGIPSRAGGCGFSPSNSPF